MFFEGFLPVWMILWIYSHPSSSINATEGEGSISTSAGTEISFRKGTWSYFVGGLLNQELT